MPGDGLGLRRGEGGKWLMLRAAKRQGRTRERVVFDTTSSSALCVLYEHFLYEATVGN